jgi:hypothetical protein
MAAQARPRLFDDYSGGHVRSMGQAEGHRYTFPRPIGPISQAGRPCSCERHFKPIHSNLAIRWVTFFQRFFGTPTRREVYRRSRLQETVSDFGSGKRHGVKGIFPVILHYWQFLYDLDINATGKVASKILGLREH